MVKQDRYPAAMIGTNLIAIALPSWITWANLLSAVSWAGLFLGAIGGWIIFRDWIHEKLRTAKQIANIHKSHSDHYFKYLDVACRVEAKNRYVVHRRGEIISLRNDLQGFSVQSGPVSKLITNFKSNTKEITLTTSDDALPQRTCMFAQFKEPLKRGRSAMFEIVAEGLGRDGNDIDPYYSLGTRWRIDNLVIRVAFGIEIPGSIIFRVQDHVGKVIENRTMLVDPTNLEVREQIAWPRVGNIYSFHWH